MVPVEYKYKGSVADSRVSRKVCSSAPSPNGKAEVGGASKMSL